MSIRSTTVFSAVLIAVASMAIGMVIASRFNLAPTSSAQAVKTPPLNSAPMTGQIALVGGDEFGKGCEEMDRALKLPGLESVLGA